MGDPQAFALGGRWRMCLGLDPPEQEGQWQSWGPRAPVSAFSPLARARVGWDESVIEHNVLRVEPKN